MSRCANDGPEPETDQIEEHLIVLLAQQGDRDAFRRLVDRYDRRLLYFILEFCKVAINAVKIGKKEMDLANFRLA